LGSSFPNFKVPKWEKPWELRSQTFQKFLNFIFYLYPARLRLAVIVMRNFSRGKKLLKIVNISKITRSRDFGYIF
jgi:hypothetical protein